MQRMKPSSGLPSKLRSKQRNKSLQSPRPDCLDPTYPIEVSATKGFAVKRTGLRQSLLQVRFLLSKVLWTESWLNEKEEAVLLERLFQIQNFREFHWLEKNAERIKFLTELTSLYLRNRSKVSCAGVVFLFQIKSYPRHSAFLNGHEYFGMESSFLAERQLHSVSLNRKNQKSPPQRIVGVGYRDHGTYRDLSKFGTPSWQEVATASHQSQETSLCGPPNWLENLRLFIKIAGWEAFVRKGFIDPREASYLWTKD